MNKINTITKQNQNHGHCSSCKQTNSKLSPGFDSPSFSKSIQQKPKLGVKVFDKIIQNQSPQILKSITSPQSVVINCGEGLR